MIADTGFKNRTKGNGKFGRRLTMFCGLCAAVGLVGGGLKANAGSFTINGSSSSAQTLGSGTGQTGVVNSGATLTVSGKTVAVTITGDNETLTNSGTINQTGTGRVIRDNTGVSALTVTNNAGALMQAADADVIQMNVSPASIIFNNYGTLTSLNASKGGSQAIDFNAIQSGPNILNNYSTGVIQARDADAVRPGVNGVVYNAGTIKATNTTDTSDDGIDVQNNSGVVINNDTTGLIEGARHGITGGAVDDTVTFTLTATNAVGGVIKGDNGSGINIDGFNAKETVTIVNHGSIIGNGVTGDGDGVDVDGLVNITNSGLIKSMNSVGSGTTEKSEGITVGGGTITNTGTVEGDVANGNSTAVGRGITIAGVDKDVNGNSIPVQPIYGNTTITNSGLIKGQSDSGIAIEGGTSGFTVTINNQAGGMIEGDGASVAAIKTSDDNTNITNSGTIAAPNSKVAIAFGNGNNSLTVTGSAASILGDITAGSGTNSLTIDPGAGNSFSYSGNISNFSNTQLKSGTITLSGSSSLSGTTSVGGKLVLNGAISGSHVVVNNGGVIGGSGKVVNGSVTINSGGSTFPGASGSPAKLSLDLNYNGGSTAHFSITSGRHADGPRKVTAGTDYDQIVVTGSSNPVLTIGSNGAQGSTIQADGTSNSNVTLTVDLGSNASSILTQLAAGDAGYVAGGANTGMTNYFLFDLGAGTSTGYFSSLTLTDADGNTLTGTIYYSGTNDQLNGVANVGDVKLTGTLGSTVVNQEFAISYTGNYDTNSTNGGNDIVVTAVPEPSTWALVVLGGVGMLAQVWKRRKN